MIYPLSIAALIMLIRQSLTMRTSCPSIIALVASIALIAILTDNLGLAQCLILWGHLVAHWLLILAIGIILGYNLFNVLPN